MKWFLPYLALTVLLATPAQAQIFSDTPMCLTLYNSLDYEVLGHIETAEFHDEAGKLSWHRSNFRLAPEEQKKVCATGPFFDGYKLRIVLKTIMPLYTCLSDMDRIVTISKKTDENGIVMPVADCPEEKPKSQAP
jgi:hypothetical protein